MSPLKSQILGVSLAVSTAIGCIAYERLVKNFSIGVIFVLATLFYVPALIGFSCLYGPTLAGDLHKLVHDRFFIGMAILYFITWCTTPLWFIITKNQSVMAGSIYEVKYIIILALFYIAFGDKPFTVNTVVGIVLALASIYFISRS